MVYFVRPRSGRSTERQIQWAVQAVESCIQLLEAHVDRSAVEVQEAVRSQDADRIERAMAFHHEAREKLEAILAQWEEFVGLD